MKKIDLVIEEKYDHKDFEISDTEIETYEAIEEIKHSKAYDNGGIIIPDNLNEQEMIVPRVQAMFRRSRRIILSIFIISQDYYELPKRTNRANGKIYHIFKPKKFRDDQNLYQDKANMEMTLGDFKYSTSTCWGKQYQLPTIDMTKDGCQSRFRLRLISIFVPNSSSILN